MVRKAFRLIAGVVALVIGSSLPAAAAPIGIGLFSWQFDASGIDFTLGVEVFAADWPGGLVLDDVYVDFTRSDGSTDQAFFGGYDATGTGVAVGVDATSGGLQVPGYGTGFSPLPQDIVAAVLRFSFDPALGTVMVDTLGPQFDGSGLPTFELREILFEAAAAPAPVPEPSTLLLFGSPALAFALRRLRQESRSHRPNETSKVPEARQE